MNYQTILCIIFCFYSIALLGQEPDYEKTIATPNTAELGKYGAIPVSKYTGIPNISIPFYEMDFYGLKIPVGVSYHSGGGIKPMQEATWIGLGWSLTTSAAISRQIVQKSDFKGKGYVNADALPGNFTNDLRSELTSQGWDHIDTEPDIFFVNIFGNSSKFVLMKKAENDGEIGVKKLDESNNIITYDEVNDSFTILNSDGFTFSFNSKEESSNISAFNTTTSIVPQENEYTTGGNPDLDNKRMVLAWYLDEIIAPSGQILEFNYLSGDYLSVSQSNLSETVTSSYYFDMYDNNGGGGVTPHLVNNQHDYSSQKSVQTNKYLEEIVDVTTGNSIIFETSGRQDVFDETASQFYVDLLYPYPDTHKDPQKLDRIVVKNSQNEIKVIEFANDSYFNENKQDDEYKESYLRLKLDGVTVDGTKEYTFDYIQPDDLPKKTTKDIDYWGYYNGAGNEHRYPAYRIDYNYPETGPGYVEFDGGDRRSDYDFGRIGLLNKITYPTKGYTDLYYQSNTADIERDPYTSNEIPDQTLSYVNGFSTTHTRTEFWLMEGESFEYSPPEGVGNTTLDFDPDEGHIRAETFLGVDGDTKTMTFRVYNKADYEADPTGYDYTEYTYHIEVDGADMRVTPNSTYNALTFNAGEIYVFEDRTPPSPESPWDIFLTVYLQNTILTPTNQVSDPSVTMDVGGGRIYQIVSKNIDDESLSIKEFRYEDEYGNNHSSGKLMNALNYVADVVDHNLYYVTWGFRLSSYSIIGIDNSAQGHHLGYDRVDEINVSTENSSENNGFIRTDYHNYSNITNAIVNGPPIQQSIKNGKPKLEQYYANGIGIVKTIEYDYEEKLIVDLLNPASVYYMVQYNNYSSEGSQLTLISDVYQYYLTAKYFPLTKKTTISKVPEGSDLITIETYEYNEKGLPEYKTASTSVSDQSRKTYYYYPFDGEMDPEPFMDDLVEKNIISNPVLVEEYLMDTGTMHYISSKSLSTTRLIEKKKITYDTWGGMILPASVQTSVGDHPLMPKITYDKYDDLNGNLLQYTARDGVPISYIWDWDNRLPIAKVVGALESDVFFENFEELSEGAISEESKTGYICSTNGFQKSISGLSNGNYTLEYWENVNGDWQHQYQEVNVANGSYEINISGYVDDIRIYPSNALMTTYTYDFREQLTSVTDPAMLVTYYTYDEIGRLLQIKDLGENTLKQYEYNYANQD